MTQRSVFVSKIEYPFYEEIPVDIEWFGGFANSQKRKCELGLHLNFKKEYPNEKVLEVSCASINPLGKALSAMNLKKKIFIKAGEGERIGITSVESIFQSSRIYKDNDNIIGPFPEYLMENGKISKKTVKEASKGLHSYEYAFDSSLLGMEESDIKRFFANDYNISAFYDYIYMNGLIDPINIDALLGLVLGGYTAFSDLATLSLNSQAKTLAKFVGLYKAGLLKCIKNPKEYLEVFRTSEQGKSLPGAYENVQLIKNGKMTYFTPAVKCYYDKNAIIDYYDRNYSHLSNKKHEDVFQPYYVS